MNESFTVETWDGTWVTVPSGLWARSLVEVEPDNEAAGA